jgi:3-hydroxymyristoyl/3-hydroxydecanoyl-(acyl carrier protein) dehydratase
MDDHFRAFSFVDRISSVESGVRISGSYTVPEQLESFPSPLVAEAVGQLAAWAAMSVMDFRFRPVAGIAASIEMLAPVRPGQILELNATLETLDEEAIAYEGTAHSDGALLIRLEHCVGPMVPVAEFDDPQALRERFDLLRGAGAASGAFDGLPGLPLTIAGGKAGQSLTATFQVPEKAAFFGDHFPRRPVFPGTLLMHANLELAAALAGQFPSPTGGRKWTIRSVSDLKIRAFTPPGESLEIEAQLTRIESETATVKVQTRNGKRGVCNACVHFVLEKLT